MQPVISKKMAFWILFPILLLSCQTEDDLEENFKYNPAPVIHSQNNSQYFRKNKYKKIGEPQARIFNEGIETLPMNNAVIPSECGATKFSEVQMEYFTELAADPLATDNYLYYRYLNYNAAYLGIGEQYFGEDGEYTHRVYKVQRDLEKFWDMPGEISIHGQHSATLNDKEMLVEILWHLIADLESKEDLYPDVEELLEQNALSPVLPESPFFSSDALSSFNNLIILGDGLIEMFAETGIEEEVVWTGILAHEWSHQIQFDHIFSWYPNGIYESAAEETRHMELEADFFSAYFLTHKRGTAYNWKRVNEFFELFFQAGDCSFEFELHHGTPQQRMRAAQEGYQLAASSQKQGHILTPEEVHGYFMEVALAEII